MRNPFPFLAALLLASPGYSQRIVRARAAAIPALRTPLSASGASYSAVSPLRAAPSLTVPGGSAPRLAAPPAAPQILPSPAFAVEAAPAISGGLIEATPEAPGGDHRNRRSRRALREAADAISEKPGDLAAARQALEGLFSGKPSHGAGGAVVNDEGVTLVGRAARYYVEVRRLVDKWTGKQDLAESLDVMEDSYEDVWTKLKAIEAVAKSRQVGRENTHLEETLLWVDGVLKDGRRQIAVHTHRVYFHKAKNPKSEIAEGIRRVDGYLRDTMGQLKPSGKAEQALGRLDEVVLVFDTRGYAEIKEHLKARERGLSPRDRARFRFQFLDDMVEIPREEAVIRKEFNEITARHRGRGLEKIIEGVTYSRYVGLLLELRTVDHLLERGYTVLQSGRELFDADGMYITELDVVARSPEGKVSLIEAKSARVPLPFEEVLRDKVTRKLDVYSKNKKLLGEAIGAPFDEVVFAVDVGNEMELRRFLEGKQASLSSRYGFPVRFLFLESFPSASGDGATH